MRVLLLCTLALGAFAQTGMHYDVSISVVVENGVCGDNAVAEVIASAIQGEAFGVSCVMEGQSARSSAEYSLSQAKWANVMAFSEQGLYNALFNGQGNIVEFVAEQIVDDNGACMGQNYIYVNGNLFQANEESVNMRPVYANGNSIVFYKDEMWVKQAGDQDPVAVEFSCEGAACDNAELDAALDQIDTLADQLEQCQANQGGDGGCSDNLRLPILVHNEWWFCDELLEGDCTDELHGSAVTEHCPNLCGACGGAANVCDEKYHTKVLLPGIGSLYCDQLYPEECNIGDFVQETCCNTCN